MLKVVFHDFTSQSYFANGVRARDLDTCDAHTVIATMEELSAS